jgi:hypothetical protein
MGAVVRLQRPQGRARAKVGRAQLQGLSALLCRAVLVVGLGMDGVRHGWAFGLGLSRRRL